MDANVGAFTFPFPVEEGTGTTGTTHMKVGAFTFPFPEEGGGARSVVYPSVTFPWSLMVEAKLSPGGLTIDVKSGTGTETETTPTTTGAGAAETTGAAPPSEGAQRA